MSLTVEQLTVEALELNPDDRAELAERLVESLLPLTDAELKSEWSTLAVQRRDEVRNGLVEPVDGESVFRLVRQRLSE